MKKKQTNCIVNNQEDEDGFNLNPFDDSIYESTNGHQEYDSDSNTANSGSGSAQIIMISSKEKQYANVVTDYPNHVSTIR